MVSLSDIRWEDTTRHTMATTQFMPTIVHSWAVVGSSHTSTSAAVTNRLMRPMGNRTFQARAMIWSTRSLGRVALTHRSTNQTRHTLRKNHR